MKSKKSKNSILKSGDKEETKKGKITKRKKEVFPQKFIAFGYGLWDDKNCGRVIQLKSDMVLPIHSLKTIIKDAEKYKKIKGILYGFICAIPNPFNSKKKNKTR